MSRFTLALCAAFAFPGCDDLFGEKGCTDSYFPSTLTVQLDHADWADGTWSFALGYDGAEHTCWLVAGDDTGAALPDTGWSQGVGLCDTPDLALLAEDGAPVSSVLLEGLTPEVLTVRVALDDEIQVESTFTPTYAARDLETSSCTGPGREGEVTVRF